MVKSTHIIDQVLERFEQMESPSDLLKTIRQRLELTQGEAAKILGLSLRGYQLIESGESPMKNVYILALERVALSIAASEKDILKVSKQMRKEILTVAGEIV